MITAIIILSALVAVEFIMLLLAFLVIDLLEREGYEPAEPEVIQNFYNDLYETF